MTSDEFLSRIDAHMERGNELMEEVRQEMRLTREVYAREAAATREVLDRHEVAFKHGVEVIQENREAMQEVRISLREERVSARQSWRDLQREIRSNTEWIKTQTQALLKLIDEMGGGPQPA